MNRLILGTVLAFMVTITFAQQVPSNPQDEDGIRKVISAFVEARNAYDAKSMASLFAEDGECTGNTGVSHHGRAAIENLFVESLANQPNTRSSRQIKSIRFLAPDIAVVTTTGDVTGIPTHFMDINVMVKREGIWLITSFYNIRLVRLP